MLELLIAVRWGCVFPIFESLAIFILFTFQGLCLHFFLDCRVVLKYQTNLKPAIQKLIVLQPWKHNITQADLRNQIRYWCLQFRLLWPGWVSSYHCAVSRIDLFLCFSVKVPCFEGRMRVLLFHECCQGCWEKCPLGSSWSRWICLS